MFSAFLQFLHLFSVPPIACPALASVVRSVFFIVDVAARLHNGVGMGWGNFIGTPPAAAAARRKVPSGVPTVEDHMEGGVPWGWVVPAAEWVGGWGSQITKNIKIMIIKTQKTE